jgi:diguanylate cyclase (GGDEF)-like protein
MNKGILTKGPDDTIWVETSGGLAHLMHPERAFDPQPLAVSITSIERGDQVYPATRQIRLPWASLPLRFQISSPAMRNRGDLIFVYRMEGLQPDWTQNRDGVAVFSALPAGKYTFMAMARNPGQNASSALIKITVQILPPWWASRWFYAACCLALLILLGAGVLLYARNLLARRLELETLVRLRTRELEFSREQLRLQATHDGLTGMLNRGAVLRALAVEMDRARRDGVTLVVALADLDNFKQVNDAYGHLVGDEALRWFAAAVGAAMRAYDYAGRYGGEEFLLVLTQVPREAAELRVTALQSAVSNLHVRTEGADFIINCSMGATIFDPTCGRTFAEALLATADQALYAAKAAGRNRVVFQAANIQDAPREHHATTSA